MSENRGGCALAIHNEADVDVVAVRAEADPEPDVSGGRAVPRRPQLPFGRNSVLSQLLVKNESLINDGKAC